MGTPTFSNILMPLRASSSAMSGAGERHALAQRELDVAGAGRHVDDQVVEVAPVRLAQQLLQRLHGHRAAPDHRLVAIDQEADGHDLHTVVLERLHRRAVIAHRTRIHAHHLRLAGAIDIGIEQADAGAFRGQRERQVHGGRALADAALAGGHGDDVLHVRHQRHALLHSVGDHLGAQVHRHVVDARHGLGGGDQRTAQRRHLALGGITQNHVEGDVAACHLEVLDGLGRHEILAGIRVDDVLQSLQQGVGSGHGEILE
jgi:hypothetical protein